MTPAETQMLLIRLVEHRLRRDYPEGHMRSPLHCATGHEAIAVGVCAVLRPTDVVHPYYRSRHWYVARGGDLDALMAELYGKATGCARGWGGAMHLIAPAVGLQGASAIVAGGIPHAVGSALAFQLAGGDRVAVASFGDGALEEGAFAEAWHVAVLRRLPVVFVCEDNRWAVNVPLAMRQAPPRLDEGVRVAGHVLAEVQAVAAAAVATARAGGGPTLLRAVVTRGTEHCGIADPPEGLDGFLDPLRGVVSDPAVATRIEAQIEAAIAKAIAAPWPEASWPRCRQ